MAKFQEPTAKFADRLYSAMIYRGMTQVDLVKRTGISKSCISQYLSGNFNPKSQNIYSIAKVLDVSEQYLMGFDVPMDKPKVQTNDYLINVDESGIALIEIYKKLCGKDKELLVQMAERLANVRQ